ncbi:Uncharacterised protein [uncultured archaeon]|nr:Uncharacterised protein [uncultured archaeon]
MEVKMKKQYSQPFEKEELEILTEELNLDPREMYVLGFLKGFDRKTLKEWNKKGLMDFSVLI